jgi:hypothetical protein
MAASFLTRAALQQITQRVLSNVIEQLPQRLAAPPTEGPPADLQASELPRMNALALTQLQVRLAEREDQLEELQVRVATVERELGWRSTIRVAAIGILGLGLGFLVAGAVGAVGWTT